LADVPQRILEHALLDRGLGTGIQMLHRTAAAHAEVPTLGLHSLRARGGHAHQLRQLVAGTLAIDRVFNLLARQGAVVEGGLAVDVGDAEAVVIDRFYYSDWHVRSR